MSARRRVSQRDVSGRTRRSSPTRGGERSGTNGNWRRTKAFPSGAGRSPPPTEGAEALAAGCAWGVASAIQIPKRNLGRRSWASAPTPRGGTRGRHAGVVVPYGWLRRAAAIALGSGAQRSVCAAVAREWAGNAAEITPKVSSNAGQSLSHGLWPCQLPLHKGAFGDGDADCRVGPAGLLAMIMVFCHSEASAYTGRGNPSFFTMDGGLGRRVVGPYGKPDQPPSQPARSKASAPAAARNGRESTLEPSKRDKLPRSPGQRLAKRKARKEELVKFDFCPTSELCSTGYRVRRSAEGPARALVGAALIEQDSLGPHPAARQGAPRP